MSANPYSYPDMGFQNLPNLPAQNQQMAGNFNDFAQQEMARAKHYGTGSKIMAGIGGALMAGPIGAFMLPMAMNNANDYYRREALNRLAKMQLMNAQAQNQMLPIQQSNSMAQFVQNSVPSNTPLPQGGLYNSEDAKTILAGSTAKQSLDGYVDTLKNVQNDATQRGLKVIGGQQGQGGQLPPIPMDLGQAMSSMDGNLDPRPVIAAGTSYQQQVPPSPYQYMDPSLAKTMATNLQDAMSGAYAPVDKLYKAPGENYQNIQQGYASEQLGNYRKIMEQYYPELAKSLANQRNASADLSRRTNPNLRGGSSSMNHDELMLQLYGAEGLKNRGYGFTSGTGGGKPRIININGQSKRVPSAREVVPE